MAKQEKSLDEEVQRYTVSIAQKTSCQYEGVINHSDAPDVIMKYTLDMLETHKSIDKMAEDCIASGLDPHGVAQEIQKKFKFSLDVPSDAQEIKDALHRLFEEPVLFAMSAYGDMQQKGWTKQQPETFDVKIHYSRDDKISKTIVIYPDLRAQLVVDFSSHPPVPRVYIPAQSVLS